MSSIKRFFAVTFIVALFVGLTGFQSASAANNSAENTTDHSTSTTYKAADKTTKHFKCKKTPKPFVKNGVTVFSMKACFNIRILKKMGCDTEAGKNEQPAPPRDPKSKCKGWIKVNFKLKMKSPEPPEGMMCTEFNMSITIKQRMKALGLSKSIASGRVDTWARTHLKLKDVIKGWIKTNCVMIPEEPEPEEPTYEAPTVQVTPVACVNPGQLRDVIVTVHNPNPTSDTARITYRGQVYDKPVAANSQVTFTFPNQGQGTYSGTALLVTANKSVAFSVTVEECAPPPANPPAFVQFREFNDLEVNWTDDHCVTVDTPAGHTATVYWEAAYGSFATPQKTAQDGVQICSLYKAPSEVPSGGTDRITVRAVDNVTGLSVSKTTQPFVIHPTAPHPGRAQQ